MGKNLNAKTAEAKIKTTNKRRLPFWKRPLFAVVLLILAIFCFVLPALLPTYEYQKVGSLNYMVDMQELPYENAELIDGIVAPNQHLYCHVAVYNSDAYLTDAESVWEMDATGKAVREVLHYDYKKEIYPPSHQVRIWGLQYQEQRLCYLYKQDHELRLITVNPDNPEQVEEIAVRYDGLGEIVKCHATPDGECLVLLNNGEIGIIAEDGQYELLYRATYHLKENQGMLFHDVILVGDTLYGLAGQQKLVLYQWKEETWESVIPLKEGIGMSEDTDLHELGLSVIEDKLAIGVNGEVYTLASDALVPSKQLEAGLPFKAVANNWLQTVLPIFGVIFFIIGMVTGIGTFMGWKFTILSKQLLTTIPVVCVMLLVVVVTMLNSMINLNTEDILRETIAINEIAATQFTGEELTGIVGYDSVDNGQIKQLRDRLRTFVNGNISAWSRNYRTALYVRGQGEEFIYVAGSDGASSYMTNSFSTETPIDEDFYKDTHTFAVDVSYGTDSDNLHLMLVTPIYNQDGTYDAVMLLVASQNRLIQAIIDVSKQVLLHVAIWTALLIAVIVLVSSRNVKTLRDARTVIAQIAGGDFSVRVNSYTKDEVGEICVGVNDMADRLEEYITEKSRNERFYYKFVPEKFRELLHKEKFTDLALGDAQSADLSILFCDIRAFSMNSEMMTAKESFEFVNRIYGIAGPIIREHNGFIDKYIGDAVMALFESAEDAVAAGIALYQAIALNPNAEEAFGIPSVKVGIGIHSGMARIGIVGEEERMSGTVIADTVNVSSRIEALTKYYGTGMIITKATLDRMKNPDALSTRYLGMVQAAGVNEVVALYEVLECLDATNQHNRELTKMQFREAVRLFHMGDLKQSAEQFSQLAAQDTEDSASALYAGYIQGKLDKNELEHNVFRFDEK